MGYMVAFMDYAKEISPLPRLIPAGRDRLQPGVASWLNAIRLQSKIFVDYAQTLDMHGAAR